MVVGRYMLWMGQEKQYKRRRGEFVLGKVEDDASVSALCKYGCEAGCARRLVQRARNCDFQIKVE